MKAALLLLASLSLGCGTTSVQRHLLGPPGVAHSRPVRTILEGDPVPPAQPVALVQAIGRGLNADLPHLIEGLRQEAQRLGCDAIVQLRIARGTSTATAVGFAVRWVSRPIGVPRATPSLDAPWAPPPPLPSAPDAPAAAGSPPPWSAP
jgi:hypothetical protein